LDEKKKPFVHIKMPEHALEKHVRGGEKGEFHPDGYICHPCKYGYHCRQTCDYGTCITNEGSEFRPSLYSFAEKLAARIEDEDESLCMTCYSDKDEKGQCGTCTLSAIEQKVSENFEVQSIDETPPHVTRKLKELKAVLTQKVDFPTTTTSPRPKTSRSLKDERVKQ